MSVSFLRCVRCKKVVSTAFEPVATDTPDKGLIVRAVVLCPECFENGYSETLCAQGKLDSKHIAELQKENLELRETLAMAQAEAMARQ